MGDRQGIDLREVGVDYKMIYWSREEGSKEENQEIM
jgi:hypothetical protein